jgi:hypothetical protein
MRAGWAGPDVSHPIFADDILLFGKPTEKQMRDHPTMNCACTMKIGWQFRNGGDNCWIL